VAIARLRRVCVCFYNRPRLRPEPTPARGGCCATGRRDHVYPAATLDARVLLRLRGRDGDVALADVTALGECNHVLVHGRLHRGHLQAVEGGLTFVLIGACTNGVDDESVDVHAEHECKVAVDDGRGAVVQQDRSGVGALVAQHVDLGCGQGVQLGRGVTETRNLGQVEALVPDGALGIDGRVSWFSL